eukprot:Gb_25168 [translate_table: standard]
MRLWELPDQYIIEPTDGGYHQLLSISRADGTFRPIGEVPTNHSAQTLKTHSIFGLVGIVKLLAGKDCLGSRHHYLEQETEEKVLLDGCPSVIVPLHSLNCARKPKNRIFEVVGVDPSDKGPAKGPNGTQNLVEELKCHLKVLNGLGGSLSSTCACINLLTLEITNYLKEVVKNLKELNFAKEQ